MEISVRVAWGLLALIHLMPALGAFAPGLVGRLYGVPPDGDVGILLIHRAVLFLAVLLVALYVMVDPASRRLASIVLAVSMIGFLLVYARAGMPAGELQKIALVDLLGILPLAWAGFHAWR